MGKRNGRLSDLHMVVLGWIRFHPDDPEGIARTLGADVGEIERLCADLEAAGFIERATLH
jgi:DNA-binding MarR family transcriptional regulator